MKIAIMQPYFMPYIGYFQLLNTVDKFIIYDNIEFTKKGWINRNRIIDNGKPKTITLPLKKDSDFLHINQRFLSDENSKNIRKILGSIQSNYSKSSGYKDFFPVISDILTYENKNLFDYINNSVKQTATYLNIETEIINSSTINIDHSFKGIKKVISICKYFKAKQYINPIGGKEIYTKKEFANHNIELVFHQYKPKPYNQKTLEFIPYISIIDVLLNIKKDEIEDYLNEFDMIK